MAIDTEKTLEDVSGGTPYANGSFVDHGNYIVYTVASGDTETTICSVYTAQDRLSEDERRSFMLSVS